MPYYETRSEKRGRILLERYWHSTSPDSECWFKHLIALIRVCRDEDLAVAEK